jgi:uncharacterized protein
MKDRNQHMRPKRCRRLQYGILLLCLLLALLGTCAYAKENKVNDRADLLTDDEEERLQEKLLSVAEKYDCDLVVLTVDSIGRKSPASYAEDFYEEQGYGIGSDLDGLILLVSMEERDWWIATYGKAITAFTDYGLDEIGEIIAEPLGEREYYDAFVQFVKLADTFLEEAENGEPYDYYHEYQEPMPLFARLLCSVVIGLIVALIVFLILRAQLKSVGYERGAVDYVRKGSFHLTREKDLYLYNTVTRMKIETQNSHPGGGGGSSTHTTSGGHTAGGRGGKF